MEDVGSYSTYMYSTMYYVSCVRPYGDEEDVPSIYRTTDKEERRVKRKKTGCLVRNYHVH